MSTDSGHPEHAPANTTDQQLEVRHNVRRLAHHPSIVIWDGENSDDGGRAAGLLAVRAHPIWSSLLAILRVEEIACDLIACDLKRLLVIPGSTVAKLNSSLMS